LLSGSLKENIAIITVHIGIYILMNASNNFKNIIARDMTPRILIEVHDVSEKRNLLSSYTA
jgi:hypothetical protein